MMFALAEPDFARSAPLIAVTVMGFDAGTAAGGV
jgi:hypothetical protein